MQLRRRCAVGVSFGLIGGMLATSAPPMSGVADAADLEVRFQRNEIFNGQLLFNIADGLSGDWQGRTLSCSALAVDGDVGEGSFRVALDPDCVDGSGDVDGFIGRKGTATAWRTTSTCCPAR